MFSVDSGGDTVYFLAFHPGSFSRPSVLYIYIFPQQIKGEEVKQRTMKRVMPENGMCCFPGDVGLPPPPLAQDDGLNELPPNVACR